MPDQQSRQRRRVLPSPIAPWLDQSSLVPILLSDDLGHVGGLIFEGFDSMTCGSGLAEVLVSQQGRQ